MFIYRFRYSVLVKAIALAVACLFIINDIVWAQDFSVSSSKSTLAPQLRLKPFFDKYGIRDGFSMNYAVAELRNLFTSGGLFIGENVREGNIKRLNIRHFPKGKIEIGTNLEKGSLSSGREWAIATFKFNEEKKQLKVLLLKDYANFSPKDLEELRKFGIKNATDIEHLSCPGLEGVWIINPAATEEKAIRILASISSFSHGTNRATDVNVTLENVSGSIAVARWGVKTNALLFDEIYKETKNQINKLGEAADDAVKAIKESNFSLDTASPLKADAEKVYAWLESVIAAAEKWEKESPDCSAEERTKVRELLEETQKARQKLKDRLLFMEGKTENTVFSLNEIFDSFYDYFCYPHDKFRPGMIEIKNPETSIFIKGNRNSAISLLCNIANNAIRYGENDTIKVIIDAKVVNGQVIITISDNGNGISQERLQEIWKPFQTTGGTGIGLTESRLIVKDHGGTIDVESELGKGTTFTIRLPIAATDAEPRPDVASMGAMRAGAEFDDKGNEITSAPKEKPAASGKTRKEILKELHYLKHDINNELFAFQGAVLFHKDHGYMTPQLQGLLGFSNEISNALERLYALEKEQITLEEFTSKLKVIVKKCQDHLVYPRLKAIFEDVYQRFDAKDKTQGFKRVFIDSPIACLLYVKNILSDWSPDFREQPKAVNLSALIDSVKSLKANHVNRTKIEYGAGDIEIITDEAGLTRALANIVLNASDAINKNERRGDFKIQTQLSSDEKYVKIILGDTAGGMSQDKVKAFNSGKPVGSSKGKGHGLGLTIVSEYITKRCGGTISVQSEPGKGTTFTLRLPLVSEPSSGQAIRLPLAQAPPAAEAAKIHLAVLEYVRGHDETANTERILQSLSQYDRKKVSRALGNLNRWGAIKISDDGKYKYIAGDKNSPIPSISDLEKIWKEDVQIFFRNFYDRVSTDPELLKLPYEEKKKWLNKIKSIFAITDRDIVFIKTLYASYGIKSVYILLNNDFTEDTIGTLSYLIYIDENIKPSSAKGQDIVALSQQVIMVNSFLHFFNHITRLVIMEETIRHESKTPITPSDMQMLKALGLEIHDFRDRVVSFVHCVSSIDIERCPEIHSKICANMLQLFEEYFEKQKKINDMLAIGCKYMDKGDYERLHGLVETNRTEARIMKDGINSLFAMQDKTQVDINASIKKISDIFTQTSHFAVGTIQHEFQDGLPQIEAIESQLSGIWLNLIINSSEAYEQSGMVTSSVDKGGKGKMVIKTSLEIDPAGQQFINIKFTDFASGIPKETLPNIFEKGFTTKGEKGTGLGLYIVKQTIESYGGEISVESRNIKQHPDDHCTTFTIRMPLAAPVGQGADSATYLGTPGVAFLQKLYDKFIASGTKAQIGNLLKIPLFLKALFITLFMPYDNTTVLLKEAKRLHDLIMFRMDKLEELERESGLSLGDLKTMMTSLHINKGAVAISIVRWEAILRKQSEAEPHVALGVRFKSLGVRLDLVWQVYNLIYFYQWFIRNMDMTTAHVILGLEKDLPLAWEAFESLSLSNKEDPSVKAKVQKLKACEIALGKLKELLKQIIEQDKGINSRPPNAKTGFSSVCALPIFDPVSAILALGCCVIGIVIGDDSANQFAPAAPDLSADVSAEARRAEAEANPDTTHPQANAETLAPAASTEKKVDGMVEVIMPSVEQYLAGLEELRQRLYKDLSPDSAKSGAPSGDLSGLNWIFEMLLKGNATWYGHFWEMVDIAEKRGVPRERLKSNGHNIFDNFSVHCQDLMHTFVLSLGMVGIDLKQGYRDCIELINDNRGLPPAEITIKLVNTLKDKKVTFSTNKKEVPATVPAAAESTDQLAESSQLDPQSIDDMALHELRGFMNWFRGTTRHFEDAGVEKGIFDKYEGLCKTLVYDRDKVDINRLLEDLYYQFSDEQIESLKTNIRGKVPIEFESLRQKRNREEMLGELSTVARVIKLYSGYYVGKAKREKRHIKLNDLLGCYPAVKQRLIESVTKDFGAGDITIYTDEVALFQVMRNLLRNAVEATSDDRKNNITIRTRLSDDPTFVLIQVEDHGTGISAENLPKIFEPFFTTKENGRGIGLAIVKDLVENRCGGTISVQSELGKGTTFTLRLPLVSEPSSGQAIRLPLAATDLSAVAKGESSLAKAETPAPGGQANAADKRFIQVGDEPIDLQATFRNEHPVIVEIGYGNGKVLKAESKKHPEWNFIGIEAQDSGIEAGQNVRLIKGDGGIVLDENFKDNSINEIRIIFPDPANVRDAMPRELVGDIPPRLFESSFITAYFRKLKPGGKLLVITEVEAVDKNVWQEIQKIPGFEGSIVSALFSDDPSKIVDIYLGNSALYTAIKKDHPEYKYYVVQATKVPPISVPSVLVAAASTGQDALQEPQPKNSSPSQATGAIPESATPAASPAAPDLSAVAKGESSLAEADAAEAGRAAPNESSPSAPEVDEFRYRSGDVISGGEYANALINKFHDYDGEVYYPCAGYDSISLVALINLFPNACRFVFNDLFEQSETSISIPDAKDISAIVIDLYMFFEPLKYSIGRFDIRIVDEKTFKMIIKVETDEAKAVLKKDKIEAIYKIGDYKNESSKYGVVYIQTPGMAGKLSRDSDFWMNILRNLDDKGFLLISRECTSQPETFALRNVATILANMEIDFWSPFVEPWEVYQFSDVHSNEQATGGTTIPTAAVGREAKADTLPMQIANGTSVVKLSVAPPVPNILTEIQQGDKAAWLNRAGDERTRHIRELILDNLNHVTFAEFKEALDRSVDIFNKTIGDTPYVVLWNGAPGASRRWVYDLISDRIAAKPAGGIYFVPADVTANNYAKMNSFIEQGVNTFVIFDDAMYSGHETSGTLQSIARMFPGENINVIIVIPYCTAISLEVLKALKTNIPEASNMTITPISMQRIKTLREVMPENDSSYLRYHGNRLNDADREDLLIGPEADIWTLTYFDHKIADVMSFMQPLRPLLAAAYGEIKPPYSVLGTPYNVAEIADYSMRQKMAESSAIHEESLRLTPTIPDKTILCHIITDSIVPAGQRNMLKQLEKNMRGSEYSEKVVALSVKTPDKFVEKLTVLMERQRELYKGYTVQFDVACPDTGLVNAVLESNLGVKALAFEPCSEMEFDLVQVEGIIMALRALNSGKIESLRDAFRFLTGKELPSELSAVTDINELIRKLIFTLPAAKVADYKERHRLNNLIRDNIKQAA